MAQTLSAESLRIQSDMLDRMRDSISGVVAAANQLKQVQSRIQGVTDKLSAWGKISRG